MKKILLILAGLLFTASLFTSCPSPAATDRVEGDLELIAESEYLKSDAKEITITLVSDTFNASPADAEGLIVVKTEEDSPLSFDFLLKDAITESNNTSATFYLADGTDETVFDKDFKVSVKKAALTKASVDEAAAELLEVGTIKIVSKASLFIAGANRVYAINAKPAEDATDNDPVRVYAQLKGCKANPTEATADISSWVSGLPEGVKAELNEAITEANGKNVAIKLTNLSANASEAVQNLTIKIPAASNTSGSELTASVKAFVLGANPTAAISYETDKGVLSGTIGSKVEGSVEYKITITGDCVSQDISKDDSDLVTALKEAIKIGTKDFPAYLDASLKADIPAGSKEFSVIIKGNNTVIPDTETSGDYPFKVSLPGSGVFLCGSGIANITNDGAKVTIAAATPAEDD